VPLRPCLECGRLSDGTRCPAHRRVVLQVKRRRRPRISRAEEDRRAATVAAWRAEHGDWCPGWRRPAHLSADLTADHVVPVGGGGSEHGALSVLCRVCNGAKQDNVE
jgi:5-methylcytosine-specific restriction protein A